MDPAHRYRGNIFLCLDSNANLDNLNSQAMPFKTEKQRVRNVVRQQIPTESPTANIQLRNIPVEATPETPNLKSQPQEEQEVVIVFTEEMTIEETLLPHLPRVVEELTLEPLLTEPALEPQLISAPVDEASELPQPVALPPEVVLQVVEELTNEQISVPLVEISEPVQPAAAPVYVEPTITMPVAQVAPQPVEQPLPSIPVIRTPSKPVASYSNITSAPSQSYSSPTVQVARRAVAQQQYQREQSNSCCSPTCAVLTTLGVIAATAAAVTGVVLLVKSSQSLVSPPGNAVSLGNATTNVPATEDTHAKWDPSKLEEQGQKIEWLDCKKKEGNILDSNGNKIGDIKRHPGFYTVQYLDQKDSFWLFDKKKNKWREVAKPQAKVAGAPISLTPPQQGVGLPFAQPQISFRQVTTKHTVAAAMQAQMSRISQQAPVIGTSALNKSLAAFKARNRG